MLLDVEVPMDVCNKMYNQIYISNYNQHSYRNRASRSSFEDITETTE